MISANERRMAILDRLCQRRHDSIVQLAIEFGVANSTMRNDIQILSCSYPIYTKQGNGGGVHMADGYRLGMKYLTEPQLILLENLSETLTGEDLITMKGILKTFKQPS